MAKKVQASIFSPNSREKYYYYTLGEKQHPCMIIIPGFTGLHDDLLPLARMFKDTHYVLVPELPGWGKSSPLQNGMTIEHYAQFLKELLDFEGIKKVIAIGHCMGSLTVLDFCLKYPSFVSEAFVISVPYLDGTLSNAVFVQIAEMTEHTPKSLRWLLFLWRNRFFGIPFEFLVLQTKTLKSKVKRIIKVAGQQSYANEDAVEDNWNSLITFPFESVQKITVPLHIIHGTKDLVVSMIQEEKFHALIPHATLDYLPKAGHVPPVETPESLANVIKTYL